jgi:mannose-6-phosphate isomerase-like protein (cupin superfamily)
MKATADADCSYLYIKDKTWTVVGLAADQAVPDKALTVDEVNRLHARGRVGRKRHEGAASRMIVDGLNSCYYPLLESLDAPQASARRVHWIEGERLAFGLFDVPAGYDEPDTASERETFIYLIRGRMHARVGHEARTVAAGDVIEIPQGARYRLRPEPPYVRYALACSTPYLERRIDGMSAAERKQARVHNRAN